MRGAQTDEPLGESEPRAGVPRPVEALAWDTEFFGVPIGRADMRRKALDDAIGEARALDLECLYLSFPAHDLAGVQGAILGGARLVELRLRFFAQMQTFDARPDPRVRLADASDRPRLLELAHRGSLLSRFARDPRFHAERVRELYERQLERCLTEGAVLFSARGGESVFAVYEDGRTCEVVLVEVDPRDRHLGLSLVMARAAAYALPTPTRCFTSIEASRTAAMRLATEMGMRVRTSAVLLHLWLDELQ